MTFLEVLKGLMVVRSVSLLLKDVLRGFSSFWSRLRVLPVWDDMATSDLLFVLCRDPTFHAAPKGKEARKNRAEQSGEQVAFLTEGAFEALLLVTGFLSENFHLKVKPQNLRYTDFAQNGDRQKDLIFVGRGVGNLGTAKVCRAIEKLEYHFWDPVEPGQEGDRRIKNSKGEVQPQWSREWDAYSRRDVVDRAMVIKAENPFCPGKKVLVIAGAHAHGTVAAVKFLTNPEYLNALRKGFKKRGVDWERDFQFFVEQKLQPEGDTYTSIQKPKLIVDSIHNLADGR